MAWIYVPEVELGASPSSDVDCHEQSATSKTSRTASSLSSSDSTTDGCNQHQSLMTCEHSTGDRGVDEWISSLGVSPASLGALQENSKGKPTSAIFGPTQGESFAKWDPDSFSLRTYQASLFGGWEEYSESLPPTGMMRNGQLYRLQTLVRRTCGSGSGLWPTPSAQEPGWKHRTPLDKDGNPPTHPNQRFYDAETGRVMQKGLSQVARMWPTPRAANPGSRTDSKGGKVLAQEVEMAEGLRQPNGRMWPTPRVSAAHGTSQAEIDANDPKRRLETAAAVADRDSGKPIGGQLNPTFVEWLMGWPRDWSALEPLVYDDGVWLNKTDWDAEWEGVPRVAKGIPDRVSRLKMIGNGWVPQVALYVARRIIDAMEDDI